MSLQLDPLVGSYLKVIGLAGVVLLSVGCGNEETGARNITPQATSASNSISLNGTAPAAASSSVAPPPSAIPTSAGAVAVAEGGQKDDNGEDLGLQELNSALNQYVENFDKMPLAMEELIRNGYIAAIPKPPPGKRYQIDVKTRKIVIAN